MNINVQKDIAASILREVRRALKLPKEAICIAGGAPRNWELGQEANDLDIYIRFEDLGKFAERPLKTKSKIRRLLNIVLKNFAGLKELDSSSDYVAGEGLVCVVEGRRFGQKVQLMIFNNNNRDVEGFVHGITDYYGGTLGSFIDDVLVSFDINLCKIAFTEDGIKRTPEFKTDKENKTLTMEAWRFGVGSRNINLRENHYLEKLMRYFPDYDFIMERTYK